MKRIQMRGPLIPNNNQEAYDYFGMEATSAKKIIDQLPDDGSDVVLEVNSNGGVVTVGSDIYTALKNYPGHITAEITGMAASAASFSIMGADKVVISPTAQIMIHKALVLCASGNSDELTSMADALEASDKAIVNAYVSKTGLDASEIMAMMQKETYMSAQEAVNRGFADEVMTFEVTNSLNAGLLPQAVVDDFYNRHAKRKSEIDSMRLAIEKDEILSGL
ncbi:head maturation protease, ClpP-related [Streptococcus jiangjianxini]|uniref:head maturation protease, ClpP-related n=1 Tax=Streptococcus jiangjianxini TaxID=3161189 RepID=UPI0032EE42CA